MDFVDNLIQEESFRLSMIYREIETDILIEIAKMIKLHGLTPSGEYLLTRLNEINSLDMNVIEQISQISGKPLEDILSVMESIGIKSIDFPMYRQAFASSLIIGDIDKLNVDPFIKAMQDETTGIIKGVQTKALQQSFVAYRNTLDRAVISVNTGLLTPNQAMVNSIKQLAKEGITGSTYLREGKPINMGLEPTIYRVLRTEFIKTSNDVSHNVGLELGVKDWYITQHEGARYKVHKHAYENHSKWQGTVVTTDELSSIAGYGEITGLGGINCRHRHYAYIKGVSVEPPKQISQEENKVVSDLITKQRRYEREIRESKREILLLSENKGVEEFDNAIIAQNVILRRRQAKMRRLIKDSNGVLRRSSARERVVRVD